MNSRKFTRVFLIFFVLLFLTLWAVPLALNAVTEPSEFPGAKIHLFDDNGNKLRKQPDAVEPSEDGKSVFLVGEPGRTYYFGFGVGSGANQLFGNGGNKRNQNPNLAKNSFQLSFSCFPRLGDSSPIKVSKCYVPQFGDLANGGWFVIIEVDGAFVPRRKRYEIPIEIFHVPSGETLEFEVIVHLLPPTVIDRDFVNLWAGSEVKLNATNACVLKPSGIGAWRKRRKSVTVILRNGIEFYIPTLTSSRSDQPIGANVGEACFIADKINNKFSEATVGVIELWGFPRDRFKMQVPVDLCFPQDSLENVKPGAILYGYLLNKSALEANPDPEDHAGILAPGIEYSAKVTPNGTVELDFSDGDRPDCKKYALVLTTVRLPLKEWAEKQAPAKKSLAIRQRKTATQSFVAKTT